MGVGGYRGGVVIIYDFFIEICMFWEMFVIEGRYLWSGWGENYEKNTKGHPIFLLSYEPKTGPKFENLDFLRIFLSEVAYVKISPNLGADIPDLGRVKKLKKSLKIPRCFSYKMILSPFCNFEIWVFTTFLIERLRVVFVFQGGYFGSGGGKNSEKITEGRPIFLVFKRALNGILNQKFGFFTIFFNEMLRVFGCVTRVWRRVTLIWGRENSQKKTQKVPQFILFQITPDPILNSKILIFNGFFSDDRLLSTSTKNISEIHQARNLKKYQNMPHIFIFESLERRNFLVVFRFFSIF